jgi:hypothetical protein
MPPETTSPTKTTVRFNIKLPIVLHGQFKSACALRGQTMTDAVIQALHAYVAETNADGAVEK